MKRSEAISYLKEILEDKQVSPDAVTLEEGKDIEGYRVRIREPTFRHTIKEVASKHNFQVKEEQNEVIVYKASQ